MSQQDHPKLRPNRRKIIQTIGAGGVGTAFFTENTSAQSESKINVGEKHFVEIGMVHNVEPDFAGRHIDQLSIYYIDKSNRLNVASSDRIDEDWIKNTDRILSSRTLTDFPNTVFNQGNQRSAALSLTPQLDAYDVLPIVSDFQYPKTKVEVLDKNKIVIKSEQSSNKIDSGSKKTIDLQPKKAEVKKEYKNPIGVYQENKGESVTVEIKPKLVVRNHGNLETQFKRSDQ